MSAVAEPDTATLPPEQLVGETLHTAPAYTPQAFEKRPLQVMAMVADGSPQSNRAIIDWTRDSETPASMDVHPIRGRCLTIATLEGAHWVDPGDFVICGIAGEFYPCKPDIFAASYEPVPDPELAAPAPPLSDVPPEPHVFDGDVALWIAFRATRAAVRARLGEDAFQPVPRRLVEQARCMADFLRAAPEASDDAVVSQLSLRGKARGGDDYLLFKVRIFRAVLTIADRELAALVPPAPTDAERAASAPKPDPRELSLKVGKPPLALSETAKGR